jgi:hypothetical protein
MYIFCCLIGKITGAEVLSYQLKLKYARERNHPIWEKLSTIFYENSHTILYLIKLHIPVIKWTLRLFNDYMFCGFINIQ